MPPKLVTWSKALRPPQPCTVIKSGKVGFMLRFDSNDDYQKQRILLKFPGSEKVFKMFRADVTMVVPLDVS